ncbi:MAG: alpha/beta fold hydrolase [Desulfobacterales bacterium]|nr:MAG: alpha/beta fold hydrolase [Desulfobacterales bacterium]
MRLNYREYGTGAPVIILHGLFGSLENWHPVARQLAADFRVLTVDQRNHGRSFHSDIFNYDVMAEDLAQFMQQQNLAQAALIGHSMGGKTAMRFAFAYPQRVSRLIIVDITPKAYPPLNGEIFEALRALDVRRLASLKQADDHLQPVIPDTALRLFLLKNLKRSKEGGYKWNVNLEAIRKSHPQLTAKISGGPFPKPCLFIRGEHSDYIREADWPEVRQYFPAAELATIPAAGHWVHVEAKDDFVATVTRYLRKRRLPESL